MATKKNKDWIGVKSVDSVCYWNGGLWFNAQSSQTKDKKRGTAKDGSTVRYVDTVRLNLC